MRVALTILFILLLSAQPMAQDHIVDFESRMDGSHVLEGGHVTDIWGYTYWDDETIQTMTLPSPLLRFFEGDSVHLNLHNPSIEGHTIHLHGLDVDQANDGVPATSQFVLTGDTLLHRFNTTHAGNYIYHCHVTSTLHVAMGMYGMIIVKPANDSMTVWTNGPRFTKEYAYLASDMDQSWNDDYTTAGGLNTFAPDRFLLNGKSGIQVYQDTNMTIEMTQNDTVLLRLANIGFTINKFSFPPSMNVRIVASDGRPLPQEEISDTLRLYPGERYSVLLTAPDNFEGYVVVDYLSMHEDLHLGQNSIPINTSAVLNDPTNEIEDQVLAYPVPVIGEELYIKTPHFDQNAVILLVDLNGKVIKRQNCTGQHSTINVADVSSGTYLINCITSQGVYSRKVVIL